MDKEQKAKEYADSIPQFDDRKRYCYEDFIAGWDEALKSQWVKVEDELPKVGVKVLVLTTNKKIAISFRYTPKDIYGKVLGNDEWQGSSALNKCIIAWTPIPSFDTILQANKDVLKRLKDM